jgi:general secretion pathway protein A
MYRSFYGLKDGPFRLTPDSRFFHLSEPHQNALRVLLEGIFYRKGLVMITGSIGTGKTTLVHTALQIFSDKKMPVQSALLFNPTLTREEFLEMMLDEFEVKCTATSKPKRLAALHHMLLDTQRRGGTSVLFIDEAHLLSPELLEEVRLLGNADTHQEKLLQIVLSGQPELLKVMNRSELSALQQRIAGRAHLRPLNQEETRMYVDERLRIAGLERTNPFPAKTLEAIYGFSGGVPRLINLICEECLLLGFRAQREKIQPEMVGEAAISLGLIEQTSVVEKKPLPVMPGPSAKLEAPKSMVDVLIEAMKNNRRTTLGVSQNEQVF